MLSISIKKRLTILLLTIIFFVGSLTISLSYVDAVHEINEVFDAQLAQSARILQAQLANDLTDLNDISIKKLNSYEPELTIPFKPDSNNGNTAEHEYERKIGFQVWGNSKNLIFNTQSVGTTALSSKSLTPGVMGFSISNQDSHQWQVFSIWEKNNRYVLQVAESLDIRQELVSNISRRLILPYLISIPLLAVLIWYAIGRGLKPLHAVTKEVQNRRPDNLNPINLENIPEEVLPLTNSLNDLFTQLQNAFEKEKQFTNDAAHELRTPLAALKTHTQVAINETNTDKINHSLNNILNGVERASHLIDQMLTMARLSPTEQQESNKELISLFKCAEEVSAELSREATNKNIELTLENTYEQEVTNLKIPLSILLRNVIHNAIHYTPDGGKINILIDSENDRPMITVIDTGPGISKDQLTRVFDRFYRVLGRKQDGCGLGLAIAKQCAIHLNATIELSNRNQTGLKVLIRFH